MSEMMVFYRKYRPQRLADLFGQEHIKETLLAALTSGKISHGYLFAGPRGTGKTSTARILAKAVNCQKGQLTSDKKQLTKRSQMSKVKGQMLFSEPCNRCQSCISITNGSHLDLVEIDAASNRGIDEIRDLREKIKLSPVSGRFKVYIIDEAHMLTMEAFNALLKTLEEPPLHAIFILCTTAASKLPATIVSRLTRFNFLLASSNDLIKASLKVAKLEGIKIEDGALEVIAKAADGSFRDAMTILDQLSAKSEKITAGDVVRVATVSGQGSLFSFIEALGTRDLKGAVITIEQLAKDNFDIALFGREVVLLLEKILLIKIGVPQAVFGDLDSKEREKFFAMANSVTLGDLALMMKLFLIAEGEAKIYPLAKIPLILAVCKYCGDDQLSVLSSQSSTLRDEPSGHSTVSSDRIGSDSNELSDSSQSVGQLAHSTSSGQASQVTDNKPGLELPYKPGLEDNTRKQKTNSGNSGKVKRTGGLSQVEEKWGEFLEKVRGSNAHLFALLRSTKPAEFNGENLTLTVFWRFHKDKLEEPKIRLMLENLLQEVMGAKINLRLSLASRDSRPPKAVSQSDVVETGEDLARIAQEVFSK